MSDMFYRDSDQARLVGVLPHHAWDQIIRNDIAVNETVTLYTVPAGQILYLCEAFLRIAENTTGTGVILVRDAGDNLIRKLCSVDYKVDTTVFADHNHFWPPYEVAAGYDVCLQSLTVAVTFEGAIFGGVE